MGSGTLLLSLELVVALPYDTAVLVCGVPDLGADVEDHRIQPKGTADKILDFFLRRKRVLAKYTKEEKQKAIAIFPDINQQAEQMFHRLIEEMVQKQGVTEQLKAEQPMEWIGLMNNIQAYAREIVNNEIIFS